MDLVKNEYKSENHGLLFDYIFDPVILYDLEGRIIDLNEEAVKIVRQHRDLIIGSNIQSYMFDTTTPVVPVNFDDNNSNIASYVATYNFNDKPVKMESRIKIIEINGVSLILNILREFDIEKEAEIENERVKKELKQKVYDRTIQLEDALNELRIEIDDRIKAEKALINANDEVIKSLEKEKELGELKTRFIAMVSHEYRTPLTAILSTTYILEYLFDMQKKSEFEKQLKKIQKSVKLMTSMLEDVLVVGRNEKYEAIPHFAELDLVPLSEEVLEELKFIDDFNHVFEIDINENSVISHTDSNFIKHILKNLLTNAIKYSERGTTVKYRLHKDDEHAHFRIEDNGLGIPEADQKRLFQPFHRSKNVGTISGTGLGLSIVKKFTEALNGSITFESELDRGTTFYLKIPLQNQLK